MAGDFSVLRGTLRLLDGALTEDWIIELVCSWRPSIQMLNGDFLPASVEEIYAAPHAVPQVGVDYNVILCPVPHGRKMAEYYRENLCRLFPKGHTFRLGTPQNTQAQFTVEDYDARKTCLALRMEVALVLAVNHHLDVEQAARFEEFYEKNMRGSSLLTSSMKESSAACRKLDIAERLERLRDDDSVYFTTHENWLIFDWCVGRCALQLEIWAGDRTDISTLCHYEDYGEKAHRARMRLAVSLAGKLHSVLGDDVVVGVWHDHPVDAIRELVAEGMDIQAIFEHFADEYPMPQRISAAALLTTPEDALQSWYVVPKGSAEGQA